MLAGTTAAVEVVGHAEDLLERDPTAHTDVDQSLIAKLPIESSAGLNQVITLASPGVVADSNGFFHPDRRPRADAVLDRQPADHRPAKPGVLQPDFAGRGAVARGHHRRGARRVRRQDAAWSCTSSPSPGSIRRSRRAAPSFGYGSFKSPTGDLNLGGGSHSVRQLSCRSRDRARTGISIRRSSRPLHEPATTRRSSTVSTSTRATPTPSTSTFKRRSRASTCRTRTIRTTWTDSASGHQLVQRRARLLARHRLERAVHGQRIRSPRSP